MKKKIQKLLIRWFFKKPIRKYVDARIKGKDEDYIGYLHELLYKDEMRMVGSREALQGYYDLDIEMNRQLQTEIQQYVRD
jgi:GrpB-like predicted nucleotidyltransferase (UPF0157 family)